MARQEPHKSVRHSWHEDAQAFVLGTFLCAVSVQFLTASGLITGQTAGLGVLLSYVLPLPFAVTFFLVNIPFYVLGYLRLGARFTIKTFLAVALVSGFSELVPLYLSFETLNPWFAAFFAGATAGLGLIVIFRHGASLGGIGVLGLWMQDRFGIQAGWVQLGFDALLFAAAFFVLDPMLVVMSLAGAVVVNLIIGVNHRQDRYIGR
ncbi:YitT family protein [Nereida sp. MMG025]|uniref:YitT family protein n=1 Tax=Nereida sp. MMG025 TaxID=2909981 RepID=UPI001F4784FE|nr:YitT family protein [Nereida sp. MMG025]MCF6443124.1 YitT family protein [Nereida sp. MMG025]